MSASITKIVIRYQNGSNETYAGEHLDRISSVKCTSGRVYANRAPAEYEGKFEKIFESRADNIESVTIEY